MTDYKKLYEEANKRVAVRFGSDVARELFKDLNEIIENDEISKEIISALNMWYADESLIHPFGKYTKKQAVSWLKSLKDRI